jgi:hypothetical protein
VLDLERGGSGHAQPQHLRRGVRAAGERRPLLTMGCLAKLARPPRQLLASRGRGGFAARRRGGKTNACHIENK